MGARWPAVAVCFGLGACSFHAGDGWGRFRCDEGEPCPDGTSCIAGWCEAFDAGQVTPATCQAGGNVQLTFEAGRSAHSDIAWSGQGFGLVWTQAESPLEVRFDLIEADGTPRRAPVTISDPLVAASWPTIAWTGGVFGAFWAGQSAGGGDVVSLIYRAISSDGTVDPDDPVVLGPSESGAVPTRAQELGDGVQGVAWQNRIDGNDEVYFNLFDDEGVAGTDKLVTENLGASWFPAIAWTGEEWGVAWNDDRDGNVEIYFTRLDTDGDRLEGDRRVSNAPGPSFAPSLVWTGESYLLGWWDGRADPSEIFVARLVPGDASEIGPEVKLTPGEYGQVALLARSGNRIGATWHGFGDDLFAPVFALLDPETGGLLTEPVPVSDGGVDIDPESLAMTATDDGFAIVWGDDRSGDIEIYFARVTCR